MRFRRFLCEVGVSILITASLLPSVAAAANNAIVVGQAIDLSSPNGSIGRDYVAGIKTCFDAINAAGGINGRRVHLIVRDDQGSADGAVKAAAELIENDRVDYLFGGQASEWLSAAAIGIFL